MGSIGTPSGEEEGKNTATAMRAVKEHGMPTHRCDLARRMREGWSVLVRGHARPIEHAAEQRVVAQLDLEPGAGGSRLNIVEITPFEITGRVIVQRHPLLLEDPLCKE
jgi:hypothetical protein